MSLLCNHNIKQKKVEEGRSAALSIAYKKFALFQDDVIALERHFKIAIYSMQCAHSV